MRYAAVAAVLAAAFATTAAAQQPMAHDSMHRPAAGQPMQGQPMGHAMGGMAGMGGAQAAPSCGMMGGGAMGGMMHDSAMGGVMEGMMRVMAGSAEHLLAQKEALQLTAGQQTRLTAIQGAARTAHEAGMRDATRHGQEIDGVMRAAAPDTAALKHHFDGQVAGMTQAHFAMLRGAALARAVLTDAQRRQADSLATAMGCGMMAGHGAAAGAAPHEH